MLQEIIDGHSGEAHNQAGSQVGEARDEKVAYRTVLGGQKDGTHPAPESDLAGPRNPTAQGLHELRLRKDRARNTGQQSLETGDPSDLFSEARKQRDITDEPESDQLREGHSVKEPTGATGRAAEALPQQLKLLIPENAPRPDPTRYSKLVRNIEVSRIPTGLTHVRTAADAAHLTASLRKAPHEQLLMVVTDGNGKVLQVIQHSIGTVDGTGVYPGQLAGAAHNVDGATQAWFVHQHPSGVSEPSAADHSILRCLLAVQVGC